MSKKIYWSKLKVRDVLPTLKPHAISPTQLAKYAGAKDHYPEISLDNAKAEEAGYPKAFVQNNFLLALAERALHNFASNASILTLDITYQKLVFVKEVLTLQGVIKDLPSDKKAKEHKAIFEIWGENNSQDIVFKCNLEALFFKNLSHEKREKTLQPNLSPESLETFQATWEYELAKAKLKWFCHPGIFTRKYPGSRVWNTYL